MKRQRLVVALLVGCGIIAAAAITSLAAFVSPAHAAETVTLGQQTDAVAELFRLKQRDGEAPKEYHWFMIGQHVSSNGKNAIGYPTYKLFKDEQTCETELSVIKDDPRRSCRANHCRVIPSNKRKPANENLDHCTRVARLRLACSRAINHATRRANDPVLHAERQLGRERDDLRQYHAVL